MKTTFYLFIFLFLFSYLSFANNVHTIKLRFTQGQGHSAEAPSSWTVYSNYAIYSTGTVPDGMFGARLNTQVGEAFFKVDDLISEATSTHWVYSLRTHINTVALYNVNVTATQPLALSQRKFAIPKNTNGYFEIIATFSPVEINNGGGGRVVRGGTVTTPTNDTPPQTNTPTVPVVVPQVPAAPGSFTWTPVSYAHGDSTGDMMQYAYFNNDNKLDALYFDALRSKQIYVAYGNDDGTFGNWSDAISKPHGESTGDMMQYAYFNDDDKLDALYFDASRSKQIYVALGNGSTFGPWSGPISSPHGESTGDMMQYADFNADGFLDALYFDSSRSKQIYVAPGNGSFFGTWSGPISSPHGESTGDMIKYVDFDRNGKLDALYFDAKRSRQIYIAFGNGSTFGSWSGALSSPHAGSTGDMMQYADFTGDGFLDALYFDSSRSKQIYVAPGNGSFFGMWSGALSAPHQESTGDMIKYFDLNRDGSLDALYFDTFRSKAIHAALGNKFNF